MKVDIYKLMEKGIPDGYKPIEEISSKDWADKYSELKKGSPTKITLGSIVDKLIYIIEDCSPYINIMEYLGDNIDEIGKDFRIDDHGWSEEILVEVAQAYNIDTIVKDLYNFYAEDITLYELVMKTAVYIYNKLNNSEVNTMNMKTIYFISGHLDITAEEFNMHYKALIDKALKEECSFVVGDARGADTMAQEYLAGKTTNVTVYHMFTSPRSNVGNFKTIGGFTSNNERDAKMTKDSTTDIAWVRPGKEKSGTAKNIKRRQNKD